MAANTISFSPDILSWAAQRAGRPIHEVAKLVSKKPEAVVEGRLTLGQAEKFAQLTNVALGLLFLDHAPSPREVPLPDFRSVQDKEPLGAEFFDVYDDIVYKQSWYLDHLNEIGAEPLAFAGAHGTTASPPKLAAAMKEDLDLDASAMRKASTPEALYAYLSQCAEKAGVLVFKNGVVGNNTHRALPVSQFRGFSIFNVYCPVVFINGADAKAAWAFTLLHELAHVWIGQSAITDSSPKNHDATEVLCNAVAAEVLVPKKDFVEAWEFQSDSVDAKLERLRLAFKVSKLVIARRALDAGFVNWQTYAAVYEAARKASNGGGGGDFYASLGARNGKRFSETVSRLAVAGELSLRHAARLLNTTPTNVLNYHERRAISA